MKALKTVVERKEHWDDIYQNQNFSELSWYEPHPHISMRFITRYAGNENCHVIDIGGGNSNLVSALLEEGYRHIDVLDISKVALQKAEMRLALKDAEVNWLHGDVLAFRPDMKYDIWHDRATFHFLTDQQDVRQYIRTAAASVKTGGLLILATFSKSGPEKCSNLPVHRYSQDDLEGLLSDVFTKIECINIDHHTPLAVSQNYTYCAFYRKSSDDQRKLSHETHA